MNELSPMQQRFTAKMIVKEVQRIAAKHNISGEAAYWGYMHFVELKICEKVGRVWKNATAYARTVFSCFLYGWILKYLREL